MILYIFNGHSRFRQYAHPALSYDNRKTFLRIYTFTNNMIYTVN